MLTVASIGRKSVPHISLTDAGTVSEIVMAVIAVCAFIGGIPLMRWIWSRSALMALITHLESQVKTLSDDLEITRASLEATESARKGFSFALEANSKLIAGLTDKVTFLTERVEELDKKWSDGLAYIAALSLAHEDRPLPAAPATIASDVAKAVEKVRKNRA
jgi:chromosome segregation ATPase